MLGNGSLCDQFLCRSQKEIQLQSRDLNYCTIPVAHPTKHKIHSRTNWLHCRVRETDQQRASLTWTLGAGNPFLDQFVAGWAWYGESGVPLIDQRVHVIHQMTQQSVHPESRQQHHTRTTR